MNQHAKVIGRSLLSLMATLVIGGGVTYALFTSNTVTISQTTLTSGTAAIKLCDGIDATGWRNSVTPTLTGLNLTPGTEQEITLGQDLYIANDDGTLATTTPPAGCNTYTEAFSLSTIPMTMIPKVAAVTGSNCPALAQNELELRFETGSFNSGYGSLTFWLTNVTPYSNIFSPGQEEEVRIFARLNPTSNQQGLNCIFDITFNGQQA